MSRTTSASAASHPPEGLPGLDPAWSRLVEAPTSDGTSRTWHLLDTWRPGDPEPAGTILAVHGNPTWSYLWRDVLAGALAADGARWRVIAVDQLEMGYSERTGRPRTLAERVRDLGLLTDALELRGPVVPLGHDWGGIVASGWAVDHPEATAGLVLANTALHRPGTDAVPPVLRLALAPGVLRTGTSLTGAFLETTLRIAHPPLAPAVRAAYRAPYRTAARRRGIEQFVRDIPASADAESAAEIERIAAGVERLTVPALLLWGPQDPVFQERYLADLQQRLPHADVHRFEGAGHLVPEDADVATAVLTWLGSAPLHGREAEAPGSVPSGYDPLWSVLEARRDDPSTALVEMRPDRRTPLRRVSWRLLATRVEQIAAGLVDLGVRPGQRVSLLVPPGADLTAALYACLRIGAVVVVADAGLGLKGMTRAVKGARPDWIIGVPAALGIARALRWPGVRIAAGAPSVARALGATATLGGLAARGAGRPLPPPPAADDLAAVLFTSGSTGPAKGVRYTYRRLAGVRDALRSECGLTPETGLVAGFAPFALFGPALGCRTATPEMDVTRPATLTAERLAAAARAVDADSFFLSPAALTNVVETAGDAEQDDFARIRTVLSAGAPLGAPLLERAARIFPSAVLRTPYGMTECLMVTDVTLDDIRAAGTGNGVCVGRPAAGARVRLAPLDADGRPGGPRTTDPDVTGEIEVSAPHMLDGYDRLWLTDRLARAGTAAEPWHRTGDVGHFDAEGRLWVEGRLPHIVVTDSGVVTPVAVEQRAESAGVPRAAAVGVGPRGTQQLVVVAEGQRPGVIEGPLADAVRAAVGRPVAAVLGIERLPTDIRHNSKIDRTLLARWATTVLAGRRVPTP